MVKSSRISPLTNDIVFQRFDQSDWEFKYDQLNDTVKVRDNEIRLLRNELLSITNQFKKLKAKHDKN